MPRISIIGTGFVGAAVARYFQSKNIQTGLFDPPKGLNDASVLRDADVIFVAVPTPYYPDTGFDDSFLRDALQSIPAPGKIVVLKSTILPGTTDKLQTLFPEHRILINPEFLTETRVDYDMQEPNRQILGYTTESRRDAEMVLDLLPRARFEKIVHARVAEIVKCLTNSFYALKVAYANQMYDLSQSMGIDYEHVKECIYAEPWLGNMHWEIFHKGYRGYGGKCIPKDMRSTIQLGNQLDVNLSLLKQAEEYNNRLCEKQGLDIRWEEGSPRKNASQS